MFHRFIHKSAIYRFNAVQCALIVTLSFLFIAVSAERFASFGQSQLKVVSSTDTTSYAVTSSTWNDSLTSYLTKQYEQGFLGCTLDSTFADSIQITALVSKGNHFSAFSEIGIPSGENLEKLAKREIRVYETNGYPFAVAHFENTLVNDTTINTTVRVERGPEFTFDSLIIRSNKSFNQNYFRQLTGWKKGEQYDERVIEEVNTKISELSFVQLLQSSEILFRDGEADLYLYMADKPANTFDGIIGFQPDNETGQVVFTGDVTLDLHNALRRGEHLSLRWRRLQEATQNLEIKASLPYILNTHIGTWAEISVYRRDTSFTQTQLELALGYVLGQDKHLRAFAERWISNQLSEEVSSVNDVNIDRYGLAFQTYQLDYRPNPRSGFFTYFEGSVGSKRLVISTEENREVRNDQYQFLTNVEGYLPMKDRFVWGIRFQGGSKIDTTLQFNENFRIGGLTTLRGFDEESIFASSYGIATAELKFIIDQNSAAFVFFDQGWYERNNDDYLSDTPFGFGLGTVIGTKNGSFRLVYALGSERDNPILVRNGKIHFGFTNRF